MAATDTAPAPAPFDSLAELRREHAVLLKVARAATPADRLTDRVHEFLARAKATGTRLDAAADREAAQGVLDYWTASLFTLPGGLSARHAEAEAAAVRPATANVVLDEFDARTAGAVAESADRALAALPPEDQDLARRLLLRLVRLAPEGRTFEPESAPRAALEALGDPARVRDVLGRLAAAGAVRVTPGDGGADDRVALRDESLMRTWAKLSLWLEQRVRFRDTARYWERHDWHVAALISGELLDEARGYHDLNAVERRFVDESRGGEIRHTRNLRLIVAFMAFFALAFAAAAVWALRANAQLTAEKQVRETRQRLADMVLLTRTLAELGAARGDAERVIAVGRWNNVSKNLEADPFFAKFLGSRQAELKRVVEESNSLDGQARVKDEALAIGKAFKSEADKLRGAEARAGLKALRDVAFENVRASAEQMVATLYDKPFTQAAPYVREFWTLYWGEMVLVEDADVARAMVLFGRKLKEIDEDVGDNVRHALNDSLTDDEKKHFKAQAYWQKAPQLRTRESATTDTNRLLDRKADRKKVEQLRAILKEELLPALEAQSKTF